MDRQAKTLLTNLIGGTFQNTSWLTASDRERNIHEVLATENLLSNLRRKNERLIQSTATEIDVTSSQDCQDDITKKLPSGSPFCAASRVISTEIHCLLHCKNAAKVSHSVQFMRSVHITENLNPLQPVFSIGTPVKSDRHPGSKATLTELTPS